MCIRDSTEAHEAIIEMRSIKEQLHKYKDIVKDDEEIKKGISDVDSTLTVIEEALYQTKNQSRQDPLNFPIRLTNKLAHLNSLTQIGVAPPTQGAIEVRDELVAQIDEYLRQYDIVKKISIPGINQLIREAQVDYIIIDDDE